MWEEIWHQNQAIFRSIIRSVLIDPSAVDDVLQEAYTKLMRAGRDFPTRGETYSYIRKVVLNTSIDHYRACRRRMARLGIPLDNHDSHETLRVCDPLAILMKKEEIRFHHLILEEIRRTVSGLPSKQQEAIDITFNRRHQKIKDICKARGIPYSTVRSRVLAAIQNIRRRLKSKGIYFDYRKLK